MNDEDEVITKKLDNLPKENELDFLQYQYDRAMKAMLDSPTKANIDAFGEANVALFETQNLYHQGSKLVVQHRKHQVDDYILAHGGL